MKDGAVPFYAVGAAGILGLLYFVNAFEYHRFTEDDSRQTCKPLITKGRSLLGRDAGLMTIEELAVNRVVRFRVPRLEAESTSRIVAKAGQRVSILEGKLQVDGAEVSEPWAKSRRTHDYFHEMLVPQGCVFVLNDQRNLDRLDSRAFGPIPMTSIIYVFDVMPPPSAGAAR